MQRQDGNWCYSNHEIGQEVESFYKQLFSSYRPQEFGEILAGITPVVIDQMNEALIKPFEEEEIKDVFLSMNPNKTLGDRWYDPFFLF